MEQNSEDIARQTWIPLQKYNVALVHEECQNKKFYSS